MRVLVACECSGQVRDAFRALGHDAMSADIKPSTHPGPHYQGDVLDLMTEQWDLVIAHPPCTYLSRAYPATPKRMPDIERGARFFAAMFAWRSPRIAVENPVQHTIGRSLHGQGHPSQYIQPYEYGHPWTKATGLWLRGLPPLMPTCPLEGRGGRHAYRGRFPSWCGAHRDPARRAVTFAGIAQAMAEQWGAA